MGTRYTHRVTYQLEGETRSTATIYAEDAEDARCQLLGSLHDSNTIFSDREVQIIAIERGTDTL